MTTLIEKLSARAREKSPGFIIVMQNAEELLGQRQVREALDAVAKEDLLFGLDGSQQPNSEADILASIKLLKKAQNNGLPVLAVEYLSDRSLIGRAKQRLDELGFIAHFAPRALDRMGSFD
jgi:cysteinyl-tRNA synthetase